MQTQAEKVQLPDRDNREEREAQLGATWQKLKDALAPQLGEFKMHVWIEPLRLVDADADQLWIAAPGLASWTRERHGELLEKIAAELAGHPMRVHVIDEEEL